MPPAFVVWRLLGHPAALAFVDEVENTVITSYEYCKESTES
jgi:hypothetical protein